MRSILPRLSSLALKIRWIDLASKAYRIWKEEGSRGLTDAVMHTFGIEMPYINWIYRFDTITDADRIIINTRIAEMPSHPRFTILALVTRNTEELLLKTIESIQRQLYSNWVLCIAFDDSVQPQLKHYLDQVRATDPRIRATAQAPAGDTQDPLDGFPDECFDDFMSVIEAGDEFSEHAFYMIADVIQTHEDVDLIYCDEDKLDEKGIRFDPSFKPDWNPDLFLNVHLIGQHCFVRGSAIHKSRSDTAYPLTVCAWNFALRLDRQSARMKIRHIPAVLYHARPLSLQDRSQPVQVRMPADGAWIESVERLILERGLPADLVAIDQVLRVRYACPEPEALVSIIIPTRNRLDLLRPCLHSIMEKTRYKLLEIIVIDNQSDDPETLEYLDAVRLEPSVNVVKYDKPFNFSAINNFAASISNGSFLCLMNNDIEVISPDWLSEMVSQAGRAEIGAVGAMLYYPDDTIQHAGVVLNGAAADHLHAGLQRGADGYMMRARVVQNLSAVTAACMLVRRAVWEEVGGMDAENFPVAFNDVDFCLRVQEKGYRNLWTPYAELYHHESVSRGRDDTPEKRARYQSELAALRKRWGGLLDNDPAWNPNLSFDLRSPHPAYRPRTVKPWLRRREGL